MPFCLLPERAFPERLMGIVEHGMYREVVEGLRLAWEYRNGKPKQVEHLAREPVRPERDREVIRIRGDRKSYIAALRRLREE